MLGLDLDGSDLWPRYYFDFTVAQQEIEDWLHTREQLDEDPVWVHSEGHITGNCCGHHKDGTVTCFEPRDEI